MMSNNNNRKKKKGISPRTKAFVTGAVFIFAILVIILCIMSGALTFKTDAAKTTPTPLPTVTAPPVTPASSTPTVTPPEESNEPTKPVTYNVTVFAGHGGSADPQGTMAVNAGDDITVNFIPDTGFAVSTITVNGELVDTADSYTVNDVSEDMTIDVSFDTAAADTTPPADMTQPAQ